MSHEQGDKRDADNKKQDYGTGFLHRLQLLQVAYFGQTKITWPILSSDVMLKIPGSTSRITNILPCPVTARGSWELLTPIPSEEQPAQLDQDGQESVTLRGNLESKPDRY